MRDGCLMSLWCELLRFHNRHNGQALGYEPWWRGFNESWLPTDYIHLDNLMR
jgi:hypothetical protein